MNHSTAACSASGAECHAGRLVVRGEAARTCSMCTCVRRACAKKSRVEFGVLGV